MNGKVEGLRPIGLLLAMTACVAFAWRKVVAASGTKVE